MRINITIGDKTYPFELNSLLISEARQMKRCIALTTRDQLVQALLQEDPDAIAFMWWLAAQRAGEPLPGTFAELDFDTLDVKVSVDGEPEVSAAVQGAADPDLPTSSNQGTEAPT
jgi:hypothetical protein